MKQEIYDIVESLKVLKVCDVALKAPEDLADRPEFFFITLDNDNDTPRKTMRRYIFKNEKNASSRTVEDELGINITGDNEKKFVPTFLFSTEKLPEIGIDDIIESAAYSRGL